MNTNFTRRNFLKGGVAAAGASLLSFNQVFGFSRVLGQDMPDDDLQTIINLAATAELFATTHYLAAINGDLNLDTIQLNYMKAGFLAEQDHLELLMSLGAVPVVTEFYVPETLFSDKDLFSQITEVAETAFVGAYLAATRVFSQSAETTAFAVTTTQIAAVEAEHRALVRQIGGRLANNLSYAQYTLRNVSDAVPVLQPFLDGSGEGFVGPIAPPTAEDIAGVRAEIEALQYDSSILPFAAIAANMTAMMAEECTVTAFNQAVNIRADASTGATVQGTLAAGSSSVVVGQRAGANGSVWWQLQDGGFVRSDTVRETMACSSLPSV
jgi:rubrerythrin